VGWADVAGGFAPTVNVEVHTSPAVFEELAGEWNGLLHPTKSNNLFLRLGWQRVWWKHLARGDLWVAAVRDDDGDLVGIGPWFIEDMAGVPTIRAIGCVDVTDYLDIIASPGHEEAVTAALLDRLLDEPATTWQALDLCNIPHDSSTLELLPRLAVQRGLDVSQRIQEVCPVIRLPGDFETYLGRLDKKQRHELRRKMRRAAGADWYVVDSRHDLDAEIETFLDLMALSTPEKADFLRQPAHRQFFREMGRVMFDEGLLQLMFLVADGSPAAAMWNFAYRGRVLVYNSGLNPVDFAGLSPGIVLLAYSIQHAIEQGMQLYDFLRGDEPYKYRMGAESTTVHNISVRRVADQGHT
jgi:CelD/BcsL family acetyltransferase involved in cellulose biosynthesis